MVVATSDEPALVRIKAAFVATTIAEHFRDQGHDVLLMMDSVTRFAMAQREVGLAIGEPPATRGYTPSVFAHAAAAARARRAPAERGSITGLYTVLVEGDDMNEPVADAVRSILDGHCVLSRELAHRTTTRRSTCSQSVSRLADRDHDARGAGRGRRAARDARRLPRQGGPDHDRRVHRRAPTRRRLRDREAARRSTRSCASGPTRRRRLADTDAALIELMADRARSRVHSSRCAPITRTSITMPEA